MLRRSLPPCSSSSVARRIVRSIAGSTVAVGTAFEDMVISLLNEQCHMQVQHVGGAYDRGVDFRGHWQLPNSETQKRIAILGQCKRLQSRVAARDIREFHGVLSAQQQNQEPLLGIFASHSGFTDDALAFRASVPLVLAVVDEDGLLQWQPNAEARALLPGVSTATRYVTGAPPPRTVRAQRDKGVAAVYKRTMVLTFT